MAGIIDPDGQEEVGLLFHNRDREIVCRPGDPLYVGSPLDNLLPNVT